MHREVLRLRYTPLRMTEEERMGIINDLEATELLIGPDAAVIVVEPAGGGDF